MHSRAETSPDKSLTPWQTALIEQVMNAMHVYYCLPDKFKEKGAALKIALIGKFMEINDTFLKDVPPGELPSEEQYKILIIQLNQVLHEFDPHLEFGCDPTFIHNMKRDNKIVKLGASAQFDYSDGPSREELEAWNKSELENPTANFGFVNYQGQEGVIPDNIGYINISYLINPQEGAGETEDKYRRGPNAIKRLHEVMRGFQNKAGVILDLSVSQHGGSPEMVQNIVSFFMPDGTPINTIHDRISGPKSYEAISTPLKILNKPVVLLVGPNTFSGREETAYDLQQFNKTLPESRFTVMGQATKGGAHPMRGFPLIDSQSGEIDNHLLLCIPHATSINPISGTNWEDGPKRGVQPDIEIPEEKNAIETAVAHLRALIPRAGNTMELDHKTTPVKLEARLQQANVPGMSMAVLASNGDIVTQAVGVLQHISTATSEQPQPAPQNVTSTTTFEAASLSKPVFAYIVLKMIQDGKLTRPPGEPEIDPLDRPLHEICPFGPPHLREPPTDAYYRSLTARMILSHQAGLPNESNFGNGETYLAEPGTRFDYSGEAYRFLFEVIVKKEAELNGMPPEERDKFSFRQMWSSFETMAQKEFAKMGMAHSSFVPYKTEGSDLISRASGHDAEGKSVAKHHFDTGEVHPAASLITTAEDYAKFLKECTQNQFIRERMFAKQVSLTGKDTKAIEAGVSPQVLDHLHWGLGMGLQTNEHGHTIAFHWGDNNTSRAFTAINLSTNEAAVCLTNSANGPALFRDVIEPAVGNIDAVSEWLSKRERLPIQESVRTDIQKPIGKWVQNEMKENKQILHTFWNERVLKRNDFSIAAIKDRFLVSTDPPQGMDKAAWQAHIEQAWADPSTFENFDRFWKLFEHVPSLKQVGIAENFLQPKQPIEIKGVTPNNLQDIDQYTQDKHLSVSIALGSVKTDTGSKKTDTMTLFCSEGRNTSDIYSIQSVGKVFTGVLALELMRQGIISIEDLVTKPMRLDSSTIAALSGVPAVQQRLGEVSLHQALTHRAGLGVGEGVGPGDFVGGYGEAIASGQHPNMDNTENFLAFVPNQTSPTGDFEYSPDQTKPTGEYHYSNTGILIAGLSLVHLYNEHRKAYSDKKLEPLDFNGLMQKYIVKPAGMSSFSMNPPADFRYNQSVDTAKYMAGSPAGGAFTTTNDLLKFGQWLYQESHKPGSTTDELSLTKLIKLYGQEFCPNGIIEHSGDAPSGSAYFSLNLETGSMVAVCNDQRALAASEVGHAIEDNIFSLSANAALIDSASQPAQRQTLSENPSIIYRKRLEEMKPPGYLASTVSSKAKERDKFEPPPTIKPWR